MQLVDDRLVLSASDLINFLECEHLTWLDLEQALGRLDAEPKRADTADLVARKGDEHEARHLQQLRDQFGDPLVEVDTEDISYQGLVAAAEQTKGAMAAGAPVIFQATFLADGWRGHADFLERVESPSNLGDWSYEVVDTKLARSVKPYFIVQLCLYSEFVAGIQGTEPEQMHVILGTGERKSFQLTDFGAYYRRMRRHFRTELENGIAASYPDPVPHCGLCRWSDLCDARRTDDDHLSLVARLGRPQTATLNAAGVTTVAELAQLGPEKCPPGMGQSTFDRLRQQARLQVDQRNTNQLSYELLEPDLDPEKPRRGFALLPRPSAGDVFFDIEGDPFYEDGLEYLWGVTYLEDGEETFKPFWGTDRTEEKRAFEGFIDFVVERRERYPDMHVYHYASYEPTAMKRMMGLHATREDEVDRLLRQNVLVDLYRVVEQALRISQPSYSLKKVEAFFMPPRDASVTDGEDSILEFEKWLDTGDQALLDWIRDYNEEDCRSTLLLRDWLLERREECERQYDVEISWRPPGEGKPSDEQLQASEEVIALQRGLLEGVPDDPTERSDEEHSRWLLAQVIDYHRREAKPSWWEFFSRFDKSLEELETADSEALSGLSLVEPPVPLPKPARSLLYKLAFPAQEHKVSDGTFADPFTAQVDPLTDEVNPFSARGFDVVRVLDDEGVVEIRRSIAKGDEPLPQALIPSTHYPTKLQQAALRELAALVIADGLDGPGAYRAARAILQRAHPATGAVAPGAPLQVGSADLEETTRIVTQMNESYLFIQGPPGSGKTYTGAQLILTLLDAGHRVGVSANSHKAVHNLLHEVEKHPGDRGVDFRGLQKNSGVESTFKSELDEPLIESTDDNGAFPTAEGIDLMAGTAWLWCREEMRRSVDYLVIDEAGQVSIADALAMATAARNVILLGDPLQLAQVSQGAHPVGSGCSVLEHLLGDAGTIPPERGIFLDHTRRMHPEVCEFVSQAIYQGRLSAIEECATQDVACEGPLTGTGVRTIPLDHEGNTRQSPEEAELIAGLIERMVGGDYTKADGTTVRLAGRHFMVVTPYNSQVRCLRTKLDARGLSTVQVGTVDKFQGQEAAVVFFSMATSSGEDIPRNVEFLYSRNRLNVAVSRARCLAILVCSPNLMTIRCRTVEQMRLVNALCLLAEMSPG
jgi:predicted RecB family nuclease